MNILHTSDLHLGKMLENFSRLPEQEQFFDELISICDTEKVDIIIIAGDVYDVKNPKALAEKLFYESIKKLSNNGERLIVIVAGNHDSHERILTSKPLVEELGVIIVGYPNAKIDTASYSNYEIIESINGAFKLRFKDNIINFITLPYPSEHSLNVYFDANKELDLQKSFNEYIKQMLEDSAKIYKANEINLFIGHIFLRGGLTSMSEQAISVGGSLQLSSIIMPKADYIALGHLHRSQEINGETLSYYSGSPIAYSFSEHNHVKSVNLCSIDFINNEKVIDIKKIPLSKYIPLEIWNVLSKEESLSLCEENKDSNSYIDLRIKTNEVLPKSFFNELRSLKNNIVFISTVKEFEKTENEEISFTYNEKSLIEEFIDYYKDTNNIEPKKELLELFLKIGETENE